MGGPLRRIPARIALCLLVCQTAMGQGLVCGVGLLASLSSNDLGVVRRGRPSFDFPDFANLLVREHSDPERLASELQDDLDHGFEVYDFRDPRYVVRMRQSGYQQKDIAAIFACAHGVCATPFVRNDAGVAQHVTIIGIETQGRSDKAIARTLAEELAHGKFNHEKTALFQGHDSLILKHPEAFALLNEFQAKYRAARDIKGALRSNTDILAELHQLYREYAPGEGLFHDVLWSAKAATGKKSIDDLTLPEVLNAAVALDGRSRDYYDTGSADRRATFRRELLSTLATYHWVKDPWIYTSTSN